MNDHDIVANTIKSGPPKDQGSWWFRLGWYAAALNTGKDKRYYNTFPVNKIRMVAGEFDHLSAVSVINQWLDGAPINMESEGYVGMKELSENYIKLFEPKEWTRMDLE